MLFALCGPSAPSRTILIELTLGQCDVTGVRARTEDLMHKMCSDGERGIRSDLLNHLPSSVFGKQFGVDSAVEQSGINASTSNKTGQQITITKK